MVYVHNSLKGTLIHDYMYFSTYKKTKEGLFFSSLCILFFIVYLPLESYEIQQVNDH